MLCHRRYFATVAKLRGEVGIDVFVWQSRLAV
jgi:hypothetical protein